MGLVRDTLLRISTFNKFVNQKFYVKRQKPFKGTAMQII